VKCSFDECDNRAVGGIGWGYSKGTIPICQDCMNTYLEHNKAREKMIIDRLYNQVKKVFGN
jgi:Zn-finger protein